MALGTREILLVIRARDEASRAIRNLASHMQGLDKDTMHTAQNYMAKGTALSSLGAGIAAVGLGSAKFLSDATEAASEYSHAAGMTLTQTDKVKTSVKELEDIGRTVARAIPVPLEELQGGLYDIFSSMDVTVPQAKKLLTEFAKSAVAGQVDLQEAAQGTIGILNAYHMPASKVNDVNDLMFQLVRKGVGTYKDFSTTIGRAVPSAVRAGQSVEDLAGMMAFLTRNGLSAAMSSSSAARALDALSNPKTVDKLSHLGSTMVDAVGKERAKDLGLTADSMFKVTDAAGKFLPVSDIMERLGKAVKGLNPDELATFMYELFKGSGGTIQARRFFDIAVHNFGQLKSLTGDMRNSSGAMKQAYDIMFKQPQSQVQLLTNRYDALKTEVGNVLIPVKLRLVNIGLRLLKMWDNLDDGTKKVIVQAAALATAFTLLLGFVTMAAGAMLLFAGAATLAGVPLGVAAGLILGVVAAIALLAAGAILIYKNWGTIGPWLAKLWDGVKATFMEAWNAIWSFLQPVVTQIWTFIQEMGRIIKEVWDKIWPPFVTQVQEAWDSIWAAIGPAVQKIVEQWKAWQKQAKPLQDALVMVAKIIGVVLAGSIIVTLVTAIGAAIVIFRTLASIVGTVIDVIAAVLANIIQVAQGFIEFFSGVFTGNWSLAWEGIKDIVSGTLGAIGQLLWGAVRTLGAAAWGIVQGIGDWFQWLYDVTGGENGIVGKLIHAIVDWFTGLPGDVLAVLWQFVQGAVQFFQDLYDILVGHSIIPDLINAIVDWFAGLPGKILGILSGLVTNAVSKFTDLKNKAIARIAELGTSVAGKIQSFVKTAISKYENFKQQAQLKFYEAKAKVLAAAQEMKDQAVSKVSSMVTTVVSWIKGLPGKAKSALSTLASNVRSRATEAMNSFWTSLKDKWASIRSWFSTRAANARNAIGHISLYSIGRAALQSLYNGMMEKWRSVQNLVGGMGSWIKNHKGPITYDRRLLVDNGRALMLGLLEGLRGMMPELTKTVGDITNTVSAAGQVPQMGGSANWGSFKYNGTGHPGTGGGWYPASSGTQVNMTVNTQEINPVKHAADLGWEVARRLGV